jgi:hypothetical protein
MIKIKAKRVWKNNPDKAIFDMKVNGVPVRVKYEKASIEGLPDRFLKQYLRNAVFEQIEIVLK